MIPRRPGYGAVGAGAGVAESGLDAGNVDDRTPFISREATPSSPFNVELPGRVKAGTWNWWRVGIVAAVAVTAYSTAGHLVRFVQKQGQLSTPVSIPGTDADFQEQPLLKDIGVHSESSSNLAFIATNAYNRRGDHIGMGYPWLEGKILVEPYRDTTLEVISPRDNMAYSWTVIENNGDGVKTTIGEYAGPEVVVIFGRRPVYTIILHEYAVSSDSDGLVLSRRVESEVMCKYVRREIRSLLDDERQEMFDTMKVLWDVKTTEGKKKYGENYLDVWDIDKFHQVGASDIECDHLHDGLGFGITHSMVTLMFELSLQLVNPKIALPYWDFTIEGAVVENEFGGDYTRLREASHLWDEDWFGSVDHSDWMVKDGRWANLEVPMIEEDDREYMFADVFGRMRSPWNVNDKPYLVRGLGEMCGIPSTTFYIWPSCETHYEMQEGYTSYYGYTWHSQYQPHGPVHVWIGGNVDCKKAMDATIDIVGEEYRISVSGYSFIMRKQLFRAYTWKCHGVADEGQNAMDVMTSGQCGCTDLDLEEGDDYLGVYETFSHGYDFPDFTEAQKRDLAKIYCNGVIGIGESSQSSSPLDPTFWSLHPTMERLLSFKLMTGFDDWSWPDSPGMWTAMDGEEYQVLLSTQSDECNGHLGSDVFPYGIMEGTITPMFTFNGEDAPNRYTNRELVKFFDPQSQALPYIYDNFEWTHCKDLGWDFSDFFDVKTGKPGWVTTADSPDYGPRTGRKKVKGFEIFKKGEKAGPLYDDPMRSKKI